MGASELIRGLRRVAPSLLDSRGTSSQGSRSSDTPRSFGALDWKKTSVRISLDLDFFDRAAIQPGLYFVYGYSYHVAIRAVPRKATTFTRDLHDSTRDTE